MILVYLTEAEMNRGRIEGEHRFTESRKGKLKNHCDGFKGYDVQLLHDILGARAELAAADAFGVAWEARINNFKEADIGKTIQVRGASNHKYCLIVRERDRPVAHHNFVLVTSEAKNPRLFCVRGWIKGHDAFKFPEKNPKKEGPAHFVPQSALHPF